MLKSLSSVLVNSGELFSFRSNLIRNSKPVIATFDSSRKFHLTSIQHESHLSILRRKTGYAFGLCRKALDLHEQDLEKAEKWLRAEAVKQGWEKAQRVKSRTTSEGLIGIHTSGQRNQATMVEVKCETDFVAKNENFTNLVSQLARKLSSQKFQLSDSSENKDTINKLWIVDTEKLAELGGDLISETINKLGENIRLVRGCIMKINHSTNDTYLLPYTHAVAGKIASSDNEVVLGKYGTIIAIKKSNQELSADLDLEDETTYSKSIDDIGIRLGQHVIGLCPITVAPTSEPDPSLDDDEPTALLKQKFLLNDDITVEQFLNNSNASVLDFIRFECGEEVTST